MRRGPFSPLGSMLFARVKGLESRCRRLKVHEGSIPPIRASPYCNKPIPRHFPSTLFYVDSYSTRFRLGHTVCIPLCSSSLEIPSNGPCLFHDKRALEYRVYLQFDENKRWVIKYWIPMWIIAFEYLWSQSQSLAQREHSARSARFGSTQRLPHVGLRFA